MSKHTLFVTGEAGVPDAIKNASGDVVLRQCKACGQAEGELTDECPMFGIEPWRSERDRYNGDYADYKHADDEIAALRLALAELLGEAKGRERVADTAVGDTLVRDAGGA